MTWDHFIIKYTFTHSALPGEIVSQQPTWWISLWMCWFFEHQKSCRPLIPGADVMNKLLYAEIMHSDRLKIGMWLWTSNQCALFQLRNLFMTSIHGIGSGYARRLVIKRFRVRIPVLATIWIIFTVYVIK